MAYNNYFPAGYQPYYSTQSNAFPTQMSVGATQPTQNGIIWVQGEAGAKSYLVAPNNTVQLWDSESQTIYLKSADASGMPSMKVLDYTIRDMAAPTAQKIMEPTHEYAEKEYVDSLSAEIARLRAEIEAFKDSKGKSSKEAKNA